MGFYVSRRLTTALRTVAYLFLLGAASHATADGEPLELGTQIGIHDGQSGTVLDTHTGIHDGRSGLVLQNAPLSSAPMVQAQPLPTLEQSDSGSGQPPIVVAPYIAFPGAQAGAPGGAAGYRMLPGSRQ